MTHLFGFNIGKTAKGKTVRWGGDGKPAEVRDISAEERTQALHSMRDGGDIPVFGADDQIVDESQPAAPPPPQQTAGAAARPRARSRRNSGRSETIMSGAQTNV